MSFLQGEENCERVVGDDIILPSLFLYPPNFGVGNSWNEIYSKKVEEFRIFHIQKERERDDAPSMKSQEVYIGHAKIYI